MRKSIKVNLQLGEKDILIILHTFNYIMDNLKFSEYSDSLNFIINRVMTKEDFLYRVRELHRYISLKGNLELYNKNDVFFELYKIFSKL